MSAWPFGQSVSSSSGGPKEDVKSILARYFQKLQDDETALDESSIEQVLSLRDDDTLALLEQRQDSSLIDFLVFAFFYKLEDSATGGHAATKVPHLQYLLEQLLVAAPAGDWPRANVIADFLSIDNCVLIDELVKNFAYLDTIWSLLQFVNQEENLPLTAIFLKINENLLFARHQEYLNYIKLRPELVDDMLAHVTITPLMDFFLKIVGSDKIEQPTGILEHVAAQSFIPKCLQFFNNERFDSAVQNSVADLLKTLITISANAPIDEISIGPNILTRQLVSPQCIDQLVDIILLQRGTALNVTISVVIELIRKNNSDYDQVNLLSTTLEENYPTDRDPIYLGHLLGKFTEKLPQLFQIIDNIDNQSEVSENQIGEIFKPLGFERFKIVELIAELLHCSNMGLMNSKRARRIARKRDAIRRKDEQIHENLVDLKLDDITATNTQDEDTISNDSNDKNLNSSNNNSNSNDSNKSKSNDNDNNKNNNSNDRKMNKETHGDVVVQSEEDDDDDDDEEVDESFDIPYVNANQNEKLRTKPTLGDFFKITLYDNQIVPKILLLFLNYPWNNFWHNVVFDIIQQIFNGRMDFSYNSFIVFSIFDTLQSYQFNGLEPKMNFQITNNFILTGYKNSYKFYESHHMNLGYMGHIVLIAEEIVKFSKLYKVELISPRIFELLQENEWKVYAEQVLNDTRLMYSKILGGGTYVDDGNGNIIPQFPSDTASVLSSSDAGSDGGGLVNIEDLEEELTTESDLHEKLRTMLLSRSEEEVDERNKEKGVIILGPPPSASADTSTE
ncbi:Sap155p KNAG_0D02870 [Huiozyma naganishii CBS 8797]|uniref:SAPS-domain-containing protein n=1 Tax=Huiozyma naganishii (strain ATCC MYA-139 / BCRC 22969 / CBS 8797 / KCTC 17520 / NBRC 10181 / NCYC 3082 / Yp74L-3) TaxID=1071383 RepID=J7S710_HUIN7|nr:hypothetical protein KNAG_0D02870 [Kazachstania naganishii CBS 8797]CCK70036.1 hypothetical protein KNAG_0D02870 [Kazachstania naganishii CBS 8797]